MKNILKYLNTNKLLFGVFFFFISVGYGQLMFNNEIQRTRLGNVATALYTEASSSLSSKASSVLTIAIMQIPNENTYILGTNGPTFLNAIRDTRIVGAYLAAQGFITYDEINDVEIYFVTGEQDYGNPADMIQLKEKKYELGAVYESHKIIRLPKKRTPRHRDASGNVIMESKTRKNGTIYFAQNDGDPVNIHAEMTIIQALSVLYPNEANLPAREDIVIMSNRNYCPRCAGYLSLNGYYMPPISTTSPNSFIQTTYTERWCSPYFDNRAEHWDFPDWIKAEMFRYTVTGASRGVYDGNGLDITTLSTTDSPTGKYRVNPQVRDETLADFWWEISDNYNLVED